MELNTFLKSYVRIILLAIIAIINASLLYTPSANLISVFISIPLLTLILAIIYIVIDAWEKIYEKTEVVEAKVVPVQWDDVSDIKESLESVKKEIQENKPKIEEKREENRLIADLINKNVISANSIDKKILDRKFITILCYQIGYNNEISGKLKKLLRARKITLHRKYPRIFTDIGFVKLAYNYPFFIIPEDNVFPKSLRNLNKLADYLMKEAKVVLAEEWQDVKDSHKQYDESYFNKIKDKTNPLNFNMLIMKINRRDMRHKYIIKNDFNKEFVGELSTLVKLENLNLLEPDKVKIRDLISGSSISILILGVEDRDREKILNLEEEFIKSEEAGGLGIKNFYDYHTKDISKIKNILKKKFKDDEKINKYANLIVKNSEDYEKDLKRLGINF